VPDSLIILHAGEAEAAFHQQMLKLVFEHEHVRRFDSFWDCLLFRYYKTCVTIESPRLPYNKHTYLLCHSVLQNFSVLIVYSFIYVTLF